MHMCRYGVYAVAQSLLSGVGGTHERMARCGPCQWSAWHGGQLISLSQIQCFVMTVDEGSVTAAARALGVSPQAVSKAVNDLERSLDRTLFVRRASGLKPTPYGLTFSKKARRMLKEAQELEDFSKGTSIANREHLVLLLCIPKIANFNSISQKISTFFTSRLGAPVNVDYRPFDECMEKLAFGEADAFITIGKTVLPEMDVATIDSIDVGMLLWEKNPLAELEHLTLDDVLDTPLYLTQNFSFFTEAVSGELRASKKGDELKLMKLSMSLHGLFNALVTKRGGVVMPFIHGVDDWLPDTTTVPFSVSEVSRVPLCLVTPKQDKTEYCVAIEDLLVGGREDHAALSRAAFSVRPR